jgi:F-type H+-transporting ATPase subunit b
MPQLDFSTYPPQLFWLAVIFIVLYGLMKWVALPQVGRALDARRQRLDDDLARAQQVKAEAEAVIAAYEKVLATARAQAQLTMKETGDRLAAEAGERQRRLAEALARRIHEAEQQIAAARERALGEIRGIAVDVARSIGEKLTGVPIAEAAAGAAVDRAIGGGAG